MASLIFALAALLLVSAVVSPVEANLFDCIRTVSSANSERDQPPWEKFLTLIKDEAECLLNCDDWPCPCGDIEGLHQSCNAHNWFYTCLDLSLDDHTLRLPTCLPPSCDSADVTAPGSIGSHAACEVIKAELETLGVITAEDCSVVFRDCPSAPPAPTGPGTTLGASAATVAPTETSTLRSQCRSAMLSESAGATANAVFLKDNHDYVAGLGLETQKARDDFAEAARVHAAACAEAAWELRCAAFDVNRTADAAGAPASVSTRLSGPTTGVPVCAPMGCFDEAVGDAEDSFACSVVMPLLYDDAGNATVNSCSSVVRPCRGSAFEEGDTGPTAGSKMTPAVIAGSAVGAVFAVGLGMLLCRRRTKRERAARAGHTRFDDEDGMEPSTPTPGSKWTPGA